MTNLHQFVILISLECLLFNVYAQKESKGAKDPKVTTMPAIKPTVAPSQLDGFGKNGKDSKNGEKGKPNAKSGADPKLLAKSQSGTYLGAYTYYRGRMWRSIRYGKAPLGALRFEAPQKPENVPGIIDANATAAGCMQNIGTDNLYIPKLMSEDCLFLSVTIPEKDPSPSQNKYPVLVFIHGGSDVEGYGANSPQFDPKSFVLNGIIVVLFNYRLGALGFLTTSTLNGNYGFLDQRLAIQWVKDNIEAFGGDRNKITLAGHSAGANSVFCHLVSRGSQGLFQGAILDSNGFIYQDTRAQATDTAQIIFDGVGCPMDDIHCIKYTASAASIVSSQNSVTSLLSKFAFGPVVYPSGELPKQSLELFFSGQASKIPLMIGFNTDEGTGFAASFFLSPVNQAEYTGLEYLVTGSANAATVDSLYPWTSSTTDGRDLIELIITDSGFACPAFLAAAYAASTHPTTKVYVYEFAHALTNPNVWEAGYPRCHNKVCHFTDIEFVFNTFGGPGAYSYQPTAQEIQLAVSVNNAWSNFIKNKDPNVGSPLSTASFIPFNPTSKQYVTLDIPANSVHRSYSRAAACDFWATVQILI